MRTADASFRMKTKSVSSKPICPPKPPPIVPMAEGADHDPSARRATTTPEPKRAVPRKPALKTVRIASPYIALTSVCGVHRASSLGASGRHWARCGELGSLWKRATHLCIRKDRRRDNLVGSERLSRVDKGRQNLARFPAFACGADCQRRHSAASRTTSETSQSR